MELWALRYDPADREAEEILRAFAPGERSGGVGSLWGWALLRMVLERRGMEFPRVEREAGGKPCFPDCLQLHFSLSHTEGAVFLALSSRPVGADIERLRPAPPRLAERFGLEGEDFFRSWVRREARGKRTGRGVLRELRQETPVEEGEHFAYAATFPGYVAGVSAMEDVPDTVNRCTAEELLAAADRTR